MPRLNNLPTLISSQNALCTLCALCVVMTACEKKLVVVPFQTGFEDAQLDTTWSGRSEGNWRVEKGVLRNDLARNKALWLKARLPDNAIIEFDTWSGTSRGDLKFEMYGNGKKHASGYILIHGGWNNTVSVIARLDEHGDDRKEKRENMIVPGKKYHWTVIKNEKKIRWYLDKKPYMTFFDSDPLKGNGHDRFAFNNWTSKASYDNLKIVPWSMQTEKALGLQD